MGHVRGHAFYQCCADSGIAEAAGCFLLEPRAHASQVHITRWGSAANYRSAKPSGGWSRYDVCMLRHLKGQGLASATPEGKLWFPWHPADDLFAEASGFTNRAARAMHVGGMCLSFNEVHPPPSRIRSRREASRDPLQLRPVKSVKSRKPWLPELCQTPRMGRSQSWVLEAPSTESSPNFGRAGPRQVEPTPARFRAESRQLQPNSVVNLLDHLIRVRHGGNTTWDAKLWSFGTPLYTNIP